MPYGNVQHRSGMIGLLIVIEPVEVLYFKVRYGNGTVTYGTSSYIQVLGIEKTLLRLFTEYT